MMLTRVNAAFMPCLLLLYAGSGLAAAEPIAAEKFAAILAVIKPHDGEGKWADLPWLSSLWEARRQAAVEGKPIVLWEMDGHPLGCT
ncbi:MAG: hypothetical protein FJ271_22325 [Planctomycetes bacterium]|nr:hypothetical protein [Planctomycetota bacterium]